MAEPTVEERLSALEAQFTRLADLEVGLAKLAELEAEVARLKEERSNGASSPAPWWEQRAGAFKDSEAYAEAMRLGAEWRKSQPTAADGDDDVSP